MFARVVFLALVASVMADVASDCGHNTVGSERNTMFPPELVQAGSGFTQMNTLNVRIRMSSFYTTRAAQFDDYAGQYALDSANDVSVGSSVCWLAANLTADWAAYVGSGGLNIDDGAASPHPITYTGSISVVESVVLTGSVYGDSYTRSSENPLLFSIKITRTVIVESTDIRVHSEIRVQVVLTSHSIEVDTLAILTQNIDISATIKIATTVQYPFYVDMNRVESNNTAEFAIETNGVTNGIASDSSACDATLQTGPSYTACTQHWKFDSLAFDMARLCVDSGYDGTINAQFTVYYDVECLNGPGPDCPLNGNEAESNAVLTLKSSNLCPDVVATVDITGSLDSYEESGFTTPKNAFFENDFVYMKGEVGTTASLTITASRINNVQCGSIVVYDLISNVSPAALGFAQLSTGDALRNDFSFQLAGEFAAQTDALSSKAFSCAAEFEVQFTGMSSYQKVSMKFTPKLLQDLDSQAIAASTEISLQQRPADAAEADDTVMEAEDAEITDASSSGKSNDWVLAVVVVVVLVAVLGACVLFGYVAHKRRHKRASVDHVQHDALATGSGSTVEDMDF